MLNHIKSFFSNLVKSIQPQGDHVESLGAGTVPYLINDPTTPKLVKEVTLPASPKGLGITVHGYGGGKVKNAKQRQAVGTYITLANSIHYTQDLLSTFRPSLRNWAATRKLIVVPRAGKQLNAYYDRKHLAFFYDINPATKKLIYTVDSADIVAHELGHALLDAMRPDFWSVQAAEIWAFHEAFADISATLSIMQHDEVLEMALNETDGDLMKSNVISKMAEEMGQAIHAVTRGKAGYSQFYLRDTVNRFDYVRPNKLPRNAPHNKLANECHSFGRVFAGAWYEIMVRRFKKNLAKHDRLTALKNARDRCALLLFEAVKVAPRTVRYFDAVARAMIAVDKKHGGHCGQIMKEVFADRKILIPRIKMLSNRSWDDLAHKITAEDEVIKHADGMIVKLSDNPTIKLKDYIEEGAVQMLSAGGHNLYDLDIEVPADTYYEFDADGNMVEEIVPSDLEIVESARLCVQSASESLGDDDDTMWEVVDGKLQRTFIQ